MIRWINNQQITPISSLSIDSLHSIYDTWRVKHAITITIESKYFRGNRRLPLDRNLMYREIMNYYHHLLMNQFLNPFPSIQSQLSNVQSDKLTANVDGMTGKSIYWTKQFVFFGDESKHLLGALKGRRGQVSFMN